MRTRFRTLLLAGAASLAVSAAVAQVTTNGVPSTISQIVQVVWNGQNISAANPLPVNVVTGSSGGSVTAAGTPGTNAQAVQGIPGGVPQNSYPAQYNATLPTLANAAPGYLAVDSNGRLIQSPGAALTNLGAAGTNQSATVTTTAANLMAANTARRGWKLKNDCAVAVWISFDGTAAATIGSGNFQIPAGGYMSSEPGFVETGALSAIAASGTCALTAREY